VGGMAAAWPYCDAVVSAHNFEALDDLLTALRSPAARRPPVAPLSSVSSPSPGVAGGAQSADADLSPSFSLPVTAPLVRRWSTRR
jgi:hypothetical protein